MLKQLHDQVNKTITRIKRNQTIKVKDDPVKVNLGSGLTVADGWFNIDGHMRSFFSTWPKFVLRIVYHLIQTSSKVYSEDEYISILKNYRYIHHNLKYGIPFLDLSVDFLYASHLLEHLFLCDAKIFLNEAYRVLKPGGVFRVCVPDLKYAFALYQKGEKQSALNYFFESSQADELTYHRYMYDFELLGNILKEAGFKKIVHCSFQEGKTPDIKILDRLQEETLFVEAFK